MPVKEFVLGSTTFSRVVTVMTYGEAAGEQGTSKRPKAVEKSALGDHSTRYVEMGRPPENRGGA